MNIKTLPAHPNLEQYKKQAKELVKAANAGDVEALALINKVRTRRKGRFTLADAHFVIAREHGFPGWPKFAQHIQGLMVEDPVNIVWRQAESAVATGDVATLERLMREHVSQFREKRPPEYGPGGLRPDYSSLNARTILLNEHQFENWEQFLEYLNDRSHGKSLVAMFETAADAIVSGDASTLEQLIHVNPQLVHARSTRKHHAPLLHYLGGINGGESYRQKCPKNAMEIAKILLDAGAPIDVMAGPYGNYTALGSIATGIQPFVAGVVEPLMKTLIEGGADINANPWSIVNACLANGRPWAAEFLAARGAQLDLEGAAGVGHLDLVKDYFDAGGRLTPTTTATQMKDGFTWACEFGRADVVEFLLDRGMDVSTRLKHHGQTGLHWAAGGAHVETVKVLLARNAPVDAKDETWEATPLECALFGWRNNHLPGATPERYFDTVRLLVKAGANVATALLERDDVRAEPGMLAALRGG